MKARDVLTFIATASLADLALIQREATERLSEAVQHHRAMVTVGARLTTDEEAHVRNHRTIEAIKSVRKRLDCGLLEARNIVYAHRDEIVKAD